MNFPKAWRLNSAANLTALIWEHCGRKASRFDTFCSPIMGSCESCRATQLAAETESQVSRCSWRLFREAATLETAKKTLGGLSESLWPASQLRYQTHGQGLAALSADFKGARKKKRSPLVESRLAQKTSKPCVFSSSNSKQGQACFFQSVQGETRSGERFYEPVSLLMSLKPDTRFFALSSLSITSARQRWCMHR